MKEKLEQFKKTSFYSETDFIKDFENKAENLDDWLLLTNRWDIYKKNRSKVENPIPKIVHQVWIGGELPQKYHGWANSWKQSGWQYNLWTEEKLLEIFTDEEKEWYHKIPNPGPRSDLARYKLLSLFGGIYCDTDFERLKDMSEITDYSTLFAGVTFDTIPEISGAIVGAIPNHPLINKTLETLVQKQHTKNDYNEILFKTGPAFFSRSIFENKDLLKPTDVIFPSHYLYPLPNFVAVNSLSQKKIRKNYLKKISYAVHYWEVSWEPDSSPLKKMLKKIIKKVIFYQHWKK